MKQYIYKNKHFLKTQFLKNAKNGNKEFYEMWFTITNKVYTT